MVVILPEHKLIYIQSPRTATRSTYRWLLEMCSGIFPWPDQRSAKQRRRGGPPEHKLRHIGPAQFREELFGGRLLPQVDFLRQELDTYRYFAATRNPFDFTVTYFVDNKYNVPEVNELPQQIARKASTFLEYLQLINEAIPRHVSDDEDMARLDGVHHLLRYEDDYPNNLFAFLRASGMRITDDMTASFPRQGVTTHKRRDWRTYYCDESRQLVASLYARYLSRYGYGFDGPVPLPAD